MIKRLLLLGTLLVMLCLGSTPFLMAQKSNPKLKGSYSNKPLSLVLVDLEISYRLDFEYEKSLVEGIQVDKSFSNKSLSEALSLILKDTDIDFEIINPRLIKLGKVGTLVKQSPERLQPAPSNETPTRFNFKLSGTIKDKDTGERLPYASVIARGSISGTTSNVDGYFTLFEVPNDTALLEVQYLGYQTLYYRITPQTNINGVTILLEEGSQTLNEVLVIEKREDQLIQASKGISQIGMSPIQVATLPSFGEKDIFRSLQLLPGISGTNESSSGLYVRGGTPDQNLILFDGFTVYHVDHLFGFFSAFNSNAIKDVQIYKGGFDAKYGGRISSVVDLTGKDGNTEHFNIGAGISLLSYNGWLEAPFAKGKGSVLLAGRRSFQSDFYSNLFDSFTDQNQDETANQVPENARRFLGQQEIQPNSYFYDVNAKITFRPTENDNIAFSFYNGEDFLDNSRNFDNNSFGGFGPFRGNNTNDISFESNNTDLTNWGNWGTSLKWSKKWNDLFYSNANLSYSNYFSERDRSNETTVNRSDTSFLNNNGTLEFNDLKDFTFKLDNEYTINQQNQLVFGIQSTFNDIEYQFTQNDTIQILNRKDEGWTNTIYFQDRHTFDDQLILKGGLRASHYSVTDQIYFEPRASITYYLTDAFKITGAWGRYNQFATRIVREDILQGSRDFWLLANDENNPISSAEHFILGTGYETKNYLFSVEGYYKNLDGLSEYSTRFVTSGFGRNRSLDYEEFFFNGTGVAKGVELLLQKKSGALTGWIGYTLGEVLYDFDAFGDQPFYANQDQTHELKIVGSYKLRNWTFSSTFIYGTGRPYTAPTGYYEIGLLDGTTAEFFEISDKNALRFPDYHRLDIAATLNFNLGETKADLGLSLFNIYNRENVWYKEYEVIEGELIETDISLLGFTPSLFFNWKLK